MIKSTLMPAICAMWFKRAEALKLPAKGEKRARDQEAFIEGAMRALLAAEIVKPEESQQLAFLASIGRLDSFVTEQAKLYTAENKS